MADVSYTYDPTKIVELGKDRMRFELGDTIVDGGASSAYLSDEEIEGVLSIYPQWKRAKLELVKGLLHRFSYEVDTKVGAMDLSLSERYASLKALYEELKAEAETASSLPFDPTAKKIGPPYFHAGMHNNYRSDLLSGRGGKPSLSERLDGKGVPR